MARIFDIRVRADTAAAWTSANPTLHRGEIGFEYDTGMFKIGDNATAWASLGYAAIQTSAADTRYILASTKGVASGVASLDGSGKVPAAQIPSIRIANVQTVADQTARLALATDDDAQFVVQSSTSQTFVLPAGANPATSGNWIALPQPSIAGLEATANKDVASGYAGLDAGGLLKVAEFPSINGGTA